MLHIDSSKRSTYRGRQKTYDLVLVCVCACVNIGLAPVVTCVRVMVSIMLSPRRHVTCSGSYSENAHCTVLVGKASEESVVF